MKKILSLLITVIVIVGLIFLFSYIKKINYPNNKIIKIMKMIDDYKFEEAIDRLLEFRDQYPSYTLSGFDSDFLLLDCYVYTNQFDKFDKQIEIMGKTWKPNKVKTVLGYDFYDMIFARVAAKSLNSVYLLDVYNKVFSYNLTETETERYGLNDKEKKTLYAFDSVIRMRLDLDGLFLHIFNMMVDFTTKDEGIILLNGHMDRAFKELLSHESEIEVLNIIFVLLNYEFNDGKFYGDILFDLETFKRYLQIFKDKSYLKKEDLSYLEQIVYRDHLPENFIKVWNEVF